MMLCGRGQEQGQAYPRPLALPKPASKTVATLPDKFFIPRTLSPGAFRVGSTADRRVRSRLLKGEHVTNEKQGRISPPIAPLVIDQAVVI